ncbi:plasmid recombination protein [Streptococcus dysgalactiae]|uniref:plasmid recombination protein n=1 Tax=Streptococcus dysgalactiae TaxID=1334 RepID=UPI003D7288DE
MSYTISAHFGTKMSRDHNIRNPKVVDSEKYIDPNGYHRTIQDSTVRQAYYEVFGQSQVEYNTKQTRPDRLINDYFSKVLEAYKRDPKRNPATSQEVIFTIGNVNDCPDIKKSEEALLDFLEKWKADNPNVHVFGVYFHADEPGSAPHLHVDYILIKRENKRGMSLQVGQEGALKEIGYFTMGTMKEGNRVTAQTKWQQEARKLLRNVAREHGLEIQEPGTGRKEAKHLDTKIFKKKTALKKLKQPL